MFKTFFSKWAIFQAVLFLYIHVEVKTFSGVKIMTVIPVTIGKRNAQGNAQINAFQNPQSSATNTAPAFKANLEKGDEKKQDTFGKKPKESWAYRYRELLGSIAGWIGGDIIWAKTLRNKVQSRKNMTQFKALALNIAFDTVVGYITGKIALQIGKDKKG